MPNKRLYKIIFQSQGKVYELYAKKVAHGSLFGFVEIEEIVFGERTQVVVDPSEEQLKTEFQGVRRTFLPIHAVVRIDEVEKQGVARISPGSGNDGVVKPFPTPIPVPPPRDGKG
ncbi:MAG TPA: DUF1820 family protein [Candidatus Polarisedimenticolaceae bacterium]|nr:DUF1820 family protein [Candidatus Polarisedimenticolaceae bacterium]